jgi:hypothetical protein
MLNTRTDCRLSIPGSHELGMSSAATCRSRVVPLSWKRLAGPGTRRAPSGQRQRRPPGPAGRRVRARLIGHRLLQCGCDETHALVAQTDHACQQLLELARHHATCSRSPRTATIRSATFASAISPSTSVSSFSGSSSVRMESPFSASVSRPRCGRATRHAYLQTEDVRWASFLSRCELGKGKRARVDRLYRFLDRGSSASRSPSPMRLVASTVAKRKRPAKTEIHQACCSLG